MTAVLAVALGLLAAGCGSSSSTLSRATSAPTTVATTPLLTTVPMPSTQPAGTPKPAPSGTGPTKVMVIAEENESYGDVLGSGRAPFLDSAAHKYATATAMDAGYPVPCPSLGSYLLMTAGDRFGVCDDRSPAAHRIRANDIFHQVVVAGGQWRAYAESMTTNCQPVNSGNYLVRHVPATYFVEEGSRCKHWAVPLGSLTSGALHRDVVAGTLPEYSFVTPNACDDMHGGVGCTGGLVSTGDLWLRRWTRQIMAGPDYRAGRLVVIITWDEGISNNHIPLVVIAPNSRHVVVRQRITHCTMLRTIEDILKLPTLACSAYETSLAAQLKLLS